MTTNELIDAIVAFLEDSLGEFRLDRQTAVGENAVAVKAARAPLYYKEDPPDKDGAPFAEPDFPAVIVRTVEGSDTEDGATVTVKLIFAAFSLDNDGKAVLINMMQRARDALNKQRVVGGIYALRWPLAWRIYEDQPRPIWEGEMTTMWDVPRPIPEFREDIFE